MDLAIPLINKLLMQTNIDILRKNKLSVTQGRLVILDIFLQTDGALAHADIEKKLSSNFDRVTVYRTLQSFVEKGVIHQIPTTDNTILYALCKENCKAGQHHDEHVHFVCVECEQTTCLENIIVPKVKLPRGFKPFQAAMIVKGHCVSCKY